MQPMLEGRAKPSVNQLVFGNEQARQARKAQVGPERRRAWSGEERDAVAQEHTRGVDRVSEALPARQAAEAMAVKLIDQHAQGLETERHGQPAHGADTFRKTAPDSVSPGPKARLTTRSPLLTDSAWTTACQM